MKDGNNNLYREDEDDSYSGVREWEIVNKVDIW